MKVEKLVLYISSFMAFMPLLIKGQTITGKVCDQTGKAVEYANIVYLDSYMHYQAGSITKENGAFSIPIVDDKVSGYLITSFVGMSSDTIKISSDVQQPLLIVLKTQSEELNEVVVKGTRNLFKNGQDMITANVQNTILAKAGNLDKLMNQIPFVSGGGGKYNVFGRGEAVVYLNNRKVYDNNILNTINSDQVKKVQVITNPGTRYSADVKAVIKIYTIDNPDGIGGNVYSNLTFGRKFSNYEGASIVYNLGKCQFVGGIGYANYKTREYAEDRTAILTDPNKLYTNDVTLNYNMNFKSTNLGITFQPSSLQTLGFNTQLTMYEHKHLIDDARINHFTNDVEDFYADGRNISKIKPTKWLTNMFYSQSIGKTRIDLTNDILLGKQGRTSAYDEQSKVSVSTDNKSDYLMNSFVADLNTQLSSRFSLNYGGEFTYSHHKQSFDFAEENIETEMKKTQNKNEQLLGATFINLCTSIGKFSFTGGIRYEYADWSYFMNNMKQKSQSKTYSNLFPTLNIAYNPNQFTNVSLGYRQTVRRPGYAELNDNIEYQSRYYYVQGYSLFTHSINLLASYKNFRLIGSCDFVNDDIVMTRNIFGTKQDIVLSKASNISNYVRWSAGANWWHKFGIYTPYLEFGTGSQTFSYTYMNMTKHFNDPYVNFKVHNTFSLRKNLNIMLFVDYYGKNYSLFKETTEQWNTQLSVSKDIRNWSFQLSLNNMLSPRSHTSTTRCNWVNDISYSNRDNRNASLLISYTFNYKQKKYNTNTRTSEINRF